VEGEIVLASSRGSSRGRHRLDSRPDGVQVVGRVRVGSVGGDGRSGRSSRSWESESRSASEESLLLSLLLSLESGHLSLEDGSLSCSLTFVLDLLLLDSLERRGKKKGKERVEKDRSARRPRLLTFGERRSENDLELTALISAWLVAF